MSEVITDKKDLSEMVEVNRQDLIGLEATYYLMSTSLIYMAEIDEGEEDEHSLYDVVRRICDRLGDPVPEVIQESYDSWLDSVAEDTP